MPVIGEVAHYFARRGSAADKFLGGSSIPSKDRSKSVLEACVSELVDGADLAQGSAGVGVVEELGAAQRQPTL